MTNTGFGMMDGTQDFSLEAHLPAAVRKLPDTLNLAERVTDCLAWPRVCA